MVIEMQRHGGPKVLASAQKSLDPPGRDEIRLRHTAIGVNYHDVYVRSGLYRTLALPGVPGIEAVGVVEAVGSDVSHIRPGDRIGYVTGGYGAYAAERNLRGDLAIPLPDGLDDAAAAASLMKALTVCMLVRHVHRVQPGQVILVHAAAGGVGQLLCRWASHIGAVVIGTVGSDAKAAIATENGAKHVLFYRQDDVAARVMEISGGEGAAAVYDSVGADTFQASLDALGYEGHLVNFGQSSGPVPPFAPSLLASRSLSVSRPIIFHYLRTSERLEAMSEAIWRAFSAGAIRPIMPLTLPLSQAARAHEMLEARQSPGGIVLLP